MSDAIESIFIEIKVPNRSNIIVCEIYRPPNSSPTEFSESVYAVLSNKLLENKTCFIMGNFNLNLLNCNTNSTCQDFLNLMLSKSYIPLIRKPIRVSDVASTLIDNVFVNNSFSVITSGIIVSDITDNFPVYALMSDLCRGHTFA